MKLEPIKLMSRLWGDKFYHGKEKKWKKEGDCDCVRGFNMFVLEPIYKVSMIYVLCIGNEVVLHDGMFLITFIITLVR